MPRKRKFRESMDVIPVTICNIITEDNKTVVQTRYGRLSKSNCKFLTFGNGACVSLVSQQIIGNGVSLNTQGMNSQTAIDMPIIKNTTTPPRRMRKTAPGFEKVGAKGIRKVKSVDVEKNDAGNIQNTQISIDPTANCKILANCNENPAVHDDATVEDHANPDDDSMLDSTPLDLQAFGYNVLDDGVFNDTVFDEDAFDGATLDSPTLEETVAARNTQDCNSESLVNDSMSIEHNYFQSYEF